MLVHVERPSPRVRYVVDHVLGRMLGLDVTYVQDREEFRRSAGPKLSYGRTPMDGAVCMPWSGGIETLPEADPDVRSAGDERSLFLVEGGEDLFAGIFHLLSLLDEMRCTARDAHGRIPSASLFTVRSGIADRPWVDEKVRSLADEIERRWPGTVMAKTRYSNSVTVDMDNILRYAGRPLGRAFGASAKELCRGDWSALAERWRVRTGAAVDPFARAVDLVKQLGSAIDRAIFFFLVRGGTSFDHASDPDHPATRALITRAGEVGEVGVHPSYETQNDDGRMRQERERLQRILGRPVNVSRQHFLRWTLPSTLERSVAAGVKEEHSLGFTDRYGFRAGTCTPFPWYDLEHERETSLMLHPFAVMDSALIERMKLDPAEVVATMSGVSDLVRKVDGPFVSVWHDRYLSGHREFASWPEVFKRVMQHAKR